MEVHAHGHVQGKKSWKEYFWEFLMLFLAVFCGFLAENLRERQSEHHREKEYIISITHDLEKDTTNLHTCIRSNTGKKIVYDSMWSLLKRPDLLQHVNKLYYYFVPTTSYSPFHATEGTILQLENAGGLRLIRNKKAVDSITDYYTGVSAVEGQFATFLRYFDQYHQVTFTEFDYSQIDTLFFDPKKILDGPGRFTLLTTDKVTLRILFNKLYALWAIMDNYLEFLEGLEEKSVSTLAFLKKEYKLN